MDKKKLIHGRKYLHHRKVIIDGRIMKAERWIQCLEITGTGATFRHEYEVFELTDQKIKGGIKGMNCLNCDAHREDLQTGDHYCKELKALISPGAVKCPRQQEENRFREHIIGRFTRKD